MLLGHGWGKLTKLLAGPPYKFSDPIGLGVDLSLILATLAEAGCALLVIIGLFTRYATIPLIFTMLVAFFFVHLGDPLPKVEKIIMYMAGYFTLLLMGPGWYSVDAQLRKAA
ncbi:MAG: hypothetical protein DHS20C18_19020 [Saprospiraceae bacterium]|nr:MAG: hypothetical protein DHS20C18_19020 [Saprospiraceae bacterium]